MEKPQQENIHVLVRVRPLNYRETHVGAHTCVTTTPTSIILDNKKEYTFDSVLGIESTQEEVFQNVGYPLINGVLQGINSCVFAYGQTGAGKTYTMQGRSYEGSNMGLQPRVIQELFTRIDSVVKCTFLEIYNEQLIDLLNDAKQLPLTIREDAKRVYVENLTEIQATNFQEVVSLMMRGLANRHVSATQMNLESSRSHSIFTLVVEHNRRKSKLNFVDLAGSERQKQTSTTGERLKEAANINKSLTVLGLVINTLSENPKKFIPYRDSKLTFLLRESLGGNSKTYMIASITSASSSFQETLSTLKFASRAKNIKNQTIVNEESPTNVEQLKAEIKRLRHELSHHTIDQKDLSSKIKSKEVVEVELISQISTLNYQLSESGQYHEQLNQEMSHLREYYESRLTELEGNQSKFREQSVNGLQDKDNQLRLAMDLQKEMRMKIDTLNLRIRELQNEESGLKFKKSEMCLQIQQLTQELGQIRIDRQRLQQEVERQEEIIKQYEENVDLQLEEKQQQLSEMEKKIEQLSYQLQMQKDQGDTDQQTIEYQSLEIERVINELESKDRSISELTQERDYLQQQVNCLNEDLACNQDKLRNAEITCKRQQFRILRKQKQECKFRQLIKQQALQSSKNQEYLHSLDQFMDDTNLEIQSFNQQQQDLTIKINTLVKELNNENSQLKQQRNQLNQLYGKLQLDHQSLQDTKDQLQKDLEQNRISEEAMQKYNILKNEFLTQKSKLTEFLGSYDILNQRLIMKENEVLKLRSELKLEQTQRSKNLEEIDKLRTGKIHLANQVIEQEQSILQLNCNLQNENDAKVQENVSSILKANQKMQQDNQLLQRQNKQLMDEKEIMQRKFEEKMMFTGDFHRFRKEIGVTQQLKEQVEKTTQQYQQLLNEVVHIEEFLQKVNVKRFCSYNVVNEGSLSEKMRNYFNFLEQCEQEFELKEYKLRTNLQLLNIEQANCTLIKEENKMLKLQLKRFD